MFESKSLGADRSSVTMRLAFTPKFGLLGVRVTLPMRPVMRRQLQAFVDALARHAETGATLQPPHGMLLAA